MTLNFKVEPASGFGETVQLTAIDIIHGGFGIGDGVVWLICADGTKRQLPVATWLPFGVEVVLPDTPPGPGPYDLLVQTSDPPVQQSLAPLEVDNRATLS